MSRSVETIYRQWLMLARIPRFPRTISTRELKNILSGEGYETDIRTIQRDLDKLSSFFPLSHETFGRRNQWFWIEDAATQDLPGMEPVTALAFHLAQTWLQPLLPQATLKLLTPYFNRADEILNATTQSSLSHWPQKVAVIERGPNLKTPEINPDVQLVIYEALLEEKQIEAFYRKRGCTKGTHYKIHPLGITIRHSIVYLVCTLWDYTDIKQFSLHRFESATLLSDKALIPDSFSLVQYIEKERNFAYPLAPLPMRLKLLIDASTAEHLFESPLSDDQTNQSAKDGWVCLTATVKDTLELRWWLQGFGANVEVLEPVSLRNAFKETALQLAEVYRK